MPVVVSMLNSTGAAAAAGFLRWATTTCSSSPVRWSAPRVPYLSYIMCKAMNRSFISVIAGGFGGGQLAGG